VDFVLHKETPEAILDVDFTEEERVSVWDSDEYPNDVASSVIV
jgi:hypothetical protein